MTVAYVRFCLAPAGELSPAAKVSAFEVALFNVTLSASSGNRKSRPLIADGA